MTMHQGPGATERELVERARRGDGDAFGVLAAGSIRQMDAAARLIMRDPERAKDAVQEAYARAWRDLPGLRDPERFAAWLRRLVVHACYDELRRDRRRRLEVEIGDMERGSGEDLERSAVERDQVDRAMRRLDPDERVVVTLFYYLDLSIAEVAATLGIPEGTAKSRLFRARRSLRYVLGFDEPSPRQQLAGELR